MIRERSDAKNGALLDAAGALAMATVESAARARREASTDAGRAHATDAVNTGMDCANALKRLGATIHLGQRVGGPAPSRLELGDLVQLDTPDARRLLEVLQEALVIAERVDASRGRALAPDAQLLPGESYGTDLAESISTLVLRVRLDVDGPKGRE